MLIALNRRRSFCGRSWGGQGVVPNKQFVVQDTAMTGQATSREQPTNHGSKRRMSFRRFREMSLTARMFLLVFIAVLPAIGIQAYNEYDLRASRADDIRQQVIQITKQFGAEMGELREGARQLIVALGQLSAVKTHQGQACDALFASAKANFKNYSLLGAADVNGTIFCSSAPLNYSSVTQQAFFKRAMASDELAVGNYWVDPSTGGKMIDFAQRFRDEKGEVAGVVFAGLDLDWLSSHLAER